MTSDIFFALVRMSFFADECETAFLAKFHLIAELEGLGIIKLKQLVHAVLILPKEKGINGLINQPPDQQCANPVLGNQADGGDPITHFARSNSNLDSNISTPT